MVHEKNCYICEQCDNCYESGKDFEDHRRRRHIENCYICEQCDNLYESRGDLEDHRRRRHTEECGEKFRIITNFNTKGEKMHESKEEVSNEDDEGENLESNGKEDDEIMDEKEEDRRDVHECDVCEFVAASKNDVEKYKKEIHENKVAEIEMLERELMLFSEKYERLLIFHEKYKDEAEEKVGKYK